MTELSESTVPSELLEAKKIKVAIQGYPGSFHDIAARWFYGPGRVEVVAAGTFADLVTSIENAGLADSGLMAIENTLAGSIMGNYRLLHRSNLQATGEVYLRIRQNLLALPGQKVEDLMEVYSHPMAIAQCEEFFRQYPHIRLIEAEDTALSAQMIKTKKMARTGAIASTLAAEMYELEILAGSIETNHQNYTRFLVLEREEGSVHPVNADKVSLCFAVSHQVGSLHRLLSVLAAYELNLTKIQSTPIIGRQWEYFFFVDFVVEGKVNWKQAVEAVRPLTTELKVLGAYKQGGLHEE